MKQLTQEELGQKLLGDKAFQHILKFAPQSQRELMTFELARYFNSQLQARGAEARIDELDRFEGRWINDFEGTRMYRDIHMRQAELRKQVK